MPQIKFGLAPAGSAADLEEEDPAWATRVLRFDPEYKFALAEAMGVQPQLSRRKMPHLMAHIVRAVVDEAKRQGVVNLDELDDAKLVQLLPGDKVLQESLELWQAVTDVDVYRREYTSRPRSEAPGVERAGHGRSMLIW